LWIKSAEAHEKTEVRCWRFDVRTENKAEPDGSEGYCWGWGLKLSRDTTTDD